MRQIFLSLLLLAGLAGCTGNSHADASNRAAAEPKEPPSTGVSISGYARFGVEKGP